MEFSLLPQLQAKQIPPPYFLIVDNHKFPNSFEISQFCETHRIHLLGLHANTTFLEQPIKVVLFHSFNIKLYDYITKRNIQIKKTNLCSLVAGIFKENDFTDEIKSAFQSCGLYPINKDEINREKILRSSYRKSVKAFVFSSNLPLYVKASPMDSHSLNESPIELKYFESLDDYEDSQLPNLDSNFTEESWQLPEQQNHTAPIKLEYDVESPPLKRDVEFSEKEIRQQFGGKRTLEDTEQSQSVINFPLTQSVDLEQSQEVNFASPYEFQCAAKKFCFEIVKEIYGPHISGLIEANSLTPYSTNDLLITKVYQLLQPSTTFEGVKS